MDHQPLLVRIGQFQALVRQPAEAAERFAAYAAAGAASVTVSVGGSGEDWPRRYELAAEARAGLY